MLIEAPITNDNIKKPRLDATLRELCRFDIHLEARDFRRPPPLFAGLFELLTGRPFETSSNAIVRFATPNAIEEKRRPLVWLRIDTRYGDLASGSGRRIQLGDRLADLSEPVRRALSEGRALLVLDWSHEGRPTFWTSNIRKILHGFGVPPQNTVILTQNIAPPDPPIPGQPDINIVNAHSFIPGIWRLFFGERVRKNEFDAPFGFAAEAPAERSHHYVCMNYEATAARAFLAALLIRQEEPGFLSFRKDQFKRNMPASRAFADELNDVAGFGLHPNPIGLVNDFIAVQRHHKIDADYGTPKELFAFLPTDALSTSTLNIVTEKEMAQPDQQRFAEKTLKAIVAGLPFVVFGNHGTIRILTDSGFDVLDDLVDHSYDEASGPFQRFSAAYEEVARYLARPPGFSAEEHARIKAAAAHNRKVFEGPLFDQWVLSPINQIAALHPANTFAPFTVPENPSLSAGVT
ncbi:MAG: hypothetical protein AAGB11_14370 [Pseudomonadota bacterium]